MVRDPSIVSPSLTGVFIGGGYNKHGTGSRCTLPKQCRPPSPPDGDGGVTDRAARGPATANSTCEVRPAPGTDLAPGPPAPHTGPWLKYEDLNRELIRRIAKQILTTKAQCARAFRFAFRGACMCALCFHGSWVGPGAQTRLSTELQNNRDASLLYVSELRHSYSVSHTHCVP